MLKKIMQIIVMISVNKIDKSWKKELKKRK